MSLDSIDMATFYYGTAVIVAIGLLLMVAAVVIYRAKVEHPPRLAHWMPSQVLPARHRASMFHRGRRKSYRAV